MPERSLTHRYQSSSLSRSFQRYLTGQSAMFAAERNLSPTHEAPYRGLRVLDFGQGIASPYAAMLLSVYGAEVIKVEPPEGDWSRYLGTTYGNHTALSAVYNRGKRSLCLDLK